MLEDPGQGNPHGDRHLGKCWNEELENVNSEGLDHGNSEDLGPENPLCFTGKVLKSDKK